MNFLANICHKFPHFKKNYLNNIKKKNNKKRSLNLYKYEACNYKSNYLLKFIFESYFNKKSDKAKLKLMNNYK